MQEVGVYFGKPLFDLPFIATSNKFVFLPLPLRQLETLDSAHSLKHSALPTNDSALFQLYSALFEKDSALVKFC